ncbi:MAG: hypothetical protein PHY56_00115 [Candidatus Omnitrophica bacterium]|nr:hypothetical protein [Candidatus Omnitrophota bacterium]
MIITIERAFGFRGCCGENKKVKCLNGIEKGSHHLAIYDETHKGYLSRKNYCFKCVKKGRIPDEIKSDIREFVDIVKANL